jgi:hypothetical protein
MLGVHAGDHVACYMLDVSRVFTPCQVEHHMWTKFATPILHAIDKFENCDFFYI